MFLAAAAAVNFGQSQATSSGYVRPDAGSRAKRYVTRMFGPYAIAGAAASAGVSTWRNKPEEWEPNGRGFGKRFVSNIGRGIIKHTTAYGLDEAFKLDSSFYPSAKRSTGSKLKNAIASTFTARTRTGKRVVGFPKIAGTYTANIVAAKTWYPDRYNAADGFRMGTISLGTDVLFNLIREFVRK
jgi:hypothetical protein